MIVETHSPAQVVREALCDLPAMWNKMRDPLQRLKHRSKVDKRVLDVPQLIPYRSPVGNNWLVALLPTKKVINVAPFVWYRGRDGYYRAARVVKDGVCHHISHHVLEQYSARFNKLADPLERMKEFVRENMSFGTEYCLDNEEVRVGIPHGYITGTWAVRDEVVQLTTFVDHGKLFPDQLAQMERLDEQRYQAIRSPVRTPVYTDPWSGSRPNV